MKTFLKILQIGLLLCTGVWGQSSFPGTTANISAWNLKGFNPLARSMADTFATVISRLDPEVIALVEVNPDFIPAEICAELSRRDLWYKRVIMEQPSNLNIALIYKHGVEVTNPRFIPGSDDGNAQLRLALAADVRIGQFDFILIAVHLKSARGTTDRATRDRQTAAIAAFIRTATSGTERDVLVVGDYNMIPGQDVSNFASLNSNNNLHFISDSLAGEFTHIGTSGPGNFLDGYAIALGHTREYVAGSLRIVPMHDVMGMTLLGYRNAVSDHLPLDAVFVITEDDD